MTRRHFMAYNLSNLLGCQLYLINCYNSRGDLLEVNRLYKTKLITQCIKNSCFHYQYCFALFKAKVCKQDNGTIHWKHRDILLVHMWIYTTINRQQITYFFCLGWGWVLEYLFFFCCHYYYYFYFLYYMLLFSFNCVNFFFLPC